MFSIPGDFVERGFEFEIGYAIRAPGFSTEKFVRLILQNGILLIPRQDDG